MIGGVDFPHAFVQRSVSSTAPHVTTSRLRNGPPGGDIRFCSTQHHLERTVTSEADGTRVQRIIVESSGKEVVALVSVHELGSIADRLQLGRGFWSAIPWYGNGIPLRDRDRGVIHPRFPIAGCRNAWLHIDHMRVGGNPFRPLPSNTRFARTFHEVNLQTHDGNAAEQTSDPGVGRQTSATT